MRWGVQEAAAGRGALMDVVPNNQEAAVVSKPSTVSTLIYLWVFEKTRITAIGSHTARFFI